MNRKELKKTFMIISDRKNTLWSHGLNKKYFSVVRIKLQLGPRHSMLAIQLHLEVQHSTNCEWIPRCFQGWYGTFSREPSIAAGPHLCDRGRTDTVLQPVQRPELSSDTYGALLFNPPGSEQ